MVRDSHGKFLQVVCSRCRNKQVIFGKCSTRVKCFKCNKLLVGVSGGKVRIRTMVKEVF